MSILKRIIALEPLWWSLFGAGGMVAAFLLPVHIFIQGIVIPLGWVSPEMLGYDRMVTLIGSPLIKIYLFFLIMLPLFHSAHRIRLILEDLRIYWLDNILPFFCYGGAIVLTIATFLVILQLP